MSNFIFLNIFFFDVGVPNTVSAKTMVFEPEI